MRQAPTPLVEDIVEVEVRGAEGLFKARIKEVIGPDGDTYVAEILGGERIVLPWYSLVNIVKDVVETE